MAENPGADTGRIVLARVKVNNPAMSAIDQWSPMVTPAIVPRRKELRMMKPFKREASVSPAVDQVALDHDRCSRDREPLAPC